MPEDMLTPDGILFSDLAAELYPDADPVSQRRRLQALMQRRKLRARGPFLNDQGRAVRWFTREQADNLRSPGQPGRPRKG